MGVHGIKEMELLLVEVGHRVHAGHVNVTLVAEDLWCPHHSCQGVNIQTHSEAAVVVCGF